MVENSTNQTMIGFLWSAPLTDRKKRKRKRDEYNLGQRLVSNMEGEKLVLITFHLCNTHNYN